MAGLSRQQARLLERRNKKIAELNKNRTQALVVSYLVGYRHGMTEEDRSGLIRNVGADIRCSCGKEFRFAAIEAPDFVRDPTKIGEQEQAPSATGRWTEGRCPSCGRSHRARFTGVVIVEEEEIPDTTTAPEESGLILPVQPESLLLPGR